MNRNTLAFTGLLGASLAASSFSLAQGPNLTLNPLSLAQIRQMVPTVTPESKTVSLLDIGTPLHTSNGEDGEAINIWLRNDAGKPVCLDLTLHLRERTGRVLSGTDLPTTHETIPLGIAQVKVDLPSTSNLVFPLTGWLVLSDADTALTPGPILDAKAVVIARQPKPWATVCVGLMLAAAGTLVGSFLLWQRSWKETLALGTLMWSSESVGTNVAIGTALVTNLLALAAIPEFSNHGSKAGYGLFALILSGTATIITALFKLLEPIWINRASRFGRLFGIVVFTILSFVTMALAHAQVLLLATLFDELLVERYLDGNTAFALVLLFWMISVLLVIYASITIRNAPSAPVSSQAGLAIEPALVTSRTSMP